MSVRTNRLMGKIWGDSANPATIVVNYNNTEVYSGPAPTIEFDVSTPRSGLDGITTLCEWTTDSSESGTFPVSITVTNGTMQIHTIEANYYANDYQMLAKSDAVWPAHTPESWDAVMVDFVSLTDEELQAKYALARTDISANFTKTLVTPMASYFTSPNVNTPGSDGKNNVRINGVEKIKSPGAQAGKSATGEWSWIVPDSGTIEFDFVVNALVN